MKNILSSVGIGAAEVDTILPKTTFRPGETVEAEVEVHGGSTGQDVDDVYFALITSYRTEDGRKSSVIDKFRLTESFTIEPDEERTFDVEFTIPYSTPTTMGHTDVWVETGLDIDWALDPEDKDYIEVEPSPRLQAVFDAVESLGFTFHTAECQADPHGAFTSRRSFIQEFEFKPRSGPFAGDFDELELVPRESEGELTVHVEIDKRGGLLAEMADMDERRATLTVADADSRSVEADLRRTIEQHR
ncbi:sporulation protein [Halorussus halophilus]|uniref:sporulation protein n=1 Tax=Halorussus halophilus TaxID=2650975 RepID=UPI001300F942|nr:sporulation protein [Halorussus halophilus]